MWVNVYSRNKMNQKSVSLKISDRWCGLREYAHPCRVELLSVACPVVRRPEGAFSPNWISSTPVLGLVHDVLFDCQDFNETLDPGTSLTTEHMCRPPLMPDAAEKCLLSPLQCGLILNKSHSMSIIFRGLMIEPFQFQAHFLYPVCIQSHLETPCSVQILHSVSVCVLLILPELFYFLDM